MARVLLVGGGCRGRTLAAGLVRDGHAVRLSTRQHSHRAAIEAVGAECWIGDPDRLVTLRGALDHVTVACWLLAQASGEPERVASLHGSRLQYWLTEVIDTTVRGLVYEAVGTVPEPLLARGRELVRDACTLNKIPCALLEADRREGQRWQQQARTAIDGLLS